jgi:transglutaminase 1
MERFVHYYVRHLIKFFCLVCRALGIPSRVVSNLVSAHDANNSLTVDKYYTENMEELDYDPNNAEGADSIWNYHVWNDVWMARPDLPAGIETVLTFVLKGF